MRNCIAVFLFVLMATPVYAQSDLAGLLDAFAKREGVPIVGVRIGDADDRSTWAFVFDESATVGDRNRERQLIQAFDLAQERELRIENMTFSVEMESLIRALAPLFDPPFTKDELRDLIKKEL